MTRRLPPVFLSMVLPALLLAAAGAGAQDRAGTQALPAAGTSGGKSQTGQARQASGPAPLAQRNDGKVAVTRSDGSTGYKRPPDPKEIRKLVSWMRDGMNRADRADKQRQTRRVQNRRR
jgi:hypothetical protein